MISACSYASTTIHQERGQPLRWFGRDTPKWMRTVSQRVGFETFGGASRIRGRGVSKFSLKMGKKNGARRRLGSAVDAVAELCLKTVERFRPRLENAVHDSGLLLKISWRLWPNTYPL